MTEIMPVPRNSHITVLRPPSIWGAFFVCEMPASVLHFLCRGVHKSKIAVTIAPPAAAAAAPSTRSAISRMRRRLVRGSRSVPVSVSSAARRSVCSPVNAYSGFTKKNARSKYGDPGSRISKTCRLTPFTIPASPRMQIFGCACGEPGF